ncbi:tetratricopeptide repeat protein [Sphingomonas solaris]|uniref:Tetratricopeptide repeat protein n=1 Tax=Alterirhizorhabdus solaris TaxID=2529389 RepID=A0A558R9T9_9SPHN|nr:tetratricopeptide repeat protein [Sphingomonas solaris]TVV76145.1 tetratricopeptide repeat protein [Sphingomonas solaris]
MALTPQNEETFFREVDEELRRDQLGSFWRRYGKLLVAGIVVALLLFAGYLFWQHRREQAAGVAGEQLSSALRDVSDNKPAAAAPVLAKLADSDVAGYRATARLTSAALALDKGDDKAAIAQYGAIAADDSLAQPFRDLALIRQTAVQYDTLPPAQIIARLKPLAVAGNPWFGSAGELVGLAYRKMGKNDLAGPLFAAMAKDKDVPETIRARAMRLAGLLGADTAGQAAGTAATGPVGE